MNQKQRRTPTVSEWEGFLPKHAIVMARSRVESDQISRAKLVFLWTSGGNPEANLLLEKMVQAMGLKMEDVFVANSLEMIPKSCQVLVHLGHVQTVMPESSMQTLQTHDPETLLKNPALKKETWTTLLKAAEILGLTIPKRGDRS